jgi:hypothetical protein
MLFRLALGLIQPPIQRVPEATAMGVKWLGSEAEHSPSASADVKIQEHGDIYKAYKKECNVILKTAKANYIQNIITRSNNTSKVLWEFVNRQRGSPNNIVTGNIHL